MSALTPHLTREVIEDLRPHLHHDVIDSLALEVHGRAGLTSRSVLEALLKRGSSVVLVCSEADGQLGRAEVARLR